MFEAYLLATATPLLAGFTPGKVQGAETNETKTLGDEIAVKRPLATLAARQPFSEGSNRRQAGENREDSQAAL